MKFAKKLAAVTILATSLMLTGCGQGQVGCVDINKVMEDAPRVKTLMAEAETKMKDAEQKFEQDKAAKPDMPQEELAKLQADFQRKISGINQATATQIRSRIDVVVGEISQSKNIDVVIINITQDVIKKMQ